MFLGCLGTTRRIGCVTGIIRVLLPPPTRLFQRLQQCNWVCVISSMEGTQADRHPPRHHPPLTNSPRRSGRPKVSTITHTPMAVKSQHKWLWKHLFHHKITSWAMSRVMTVPAGTAEPMEGRAASVSRCDCSCVICSVIISALVAISDTPFVAHLHRAIVSNTIQKVQVSGQQR